MARYRLLVIASLVVNIMLSVALGFFIFREPLPDRIDTSSIVRFPRDNQRDNSTQRPQANEHSLVAASSPDSIVEYFRNAGFSGRTLSMFMNILLDEKYAAKRDQIIGKHYRPKWQTGGYKLSEDQRRALADLAVERNQELLRLVGEDYYIGLAPNINSISGLANLDPHVAGRVAEIFNDYNTAKALAATSRPSPEQSALIESNLVDDLKKVLTDQQLSMYLMFNSEQAKRLQKRLAGAPIGDKEFIAISEKIQKLRDSISAGENPGIELTFSYKLKEAEAVREGGSSEAVMYLSRQDGTFTPLAKIYENMAMKSDQVAENYITWLEFHAEGDRVQSKSKSKEETFAETKDIGAKTYHKLTEHLGPQEKEAFNSTSTGRFLKRFVEN